MKSDARSDGHKGMQTSPHALMPGADRSGLEDGPSEGVKPAHSVVEAARITGLSRATLYELNKQGAIRFTKCGRRTLILHEDLVAFLQSLRSGGASDVAGFGNSGRANEQPVRSIPLFDWPAEALKLYAAALTGTRIQQVAERAPSGRWQLIKTRVVT